MNLARFSFQNRQGVVLTALFLAMLGLLAGVRMPASILPDFPFPRIAAIVRVGDMAIQDMLLRVTRPIESAVSSVPGAKRVRTQTSRGAMDLSMDFDWGTPMFEAYTRVNAAIAEIRPKLPADTHIEVEWITPSSFPILGYSMTSPSRSPRELRELAALTVGPYLSRLKGVYRADVAGGQVREYRITVDPYALAAAGISLDAVSQAVADTNLLRSVGRFSQRHQGYLVLATARLRDLPQLLNVVVGEKDGKPVRVQDIGAVSETDEPRQQVATADGRVAALINVLKQQGASTAQVSREVRDALRDLKRRGAVPADVVFTPFYDEAGLLHDSIGSLRDAILIGAALGMLVLWLFLRSLRSTTIVALCLPLTVLISFLALRFARQSFNIMTLGALAIGLGLIIDDVVVTMENVFRRVEEGAAPDEAAVSGAYEIQRPLLGSTITRIALFLPLAFLGGVTGAFFAPLSLTLTILLVVSVGLALTVVPLICGALIHPGHTSAAEGGWFSRLRDGAYTAALTGVVRRPWLALGGTAFLVLSAALAFRELPTGFMPKMDEGAFVLEYLAPPGTPLEETDRMCRVIENELRKTPEVASYSRRTGLRLEFAMANPNAGDISVKLKPRSQRRRSMREIMADVEDRCRALLPNMTLEPLAPLLDRVRDITGEVAAVEVKVFGDDPQVLAKIAEQVRKVIAAVPGTANSVHEITRSGPELTVRIDPERAGLMGLTPAAVIDQLETAMLGRAQTQIRSGQRLIGIRVVYPPSSRRVPDQIRTLPVLGKNSKVAPLETLADIRETPGYFVVTRENQKPMIPVTAQIQGRDLGSVNRDIISRISRQVKLPPGYTIEYGGLHKTQQESFRSLLTVMVLGLLLVFIVLVCQYHGYVEAFVLLLTGVCSLSGAVFALWVTGTPFNASSFTGAIMIFGLALANGVLLVDAIGDGVLRGLRYREALLRGGRLRLRPVLMTAVIAVLTMLPLAFGVGAGAEMQKPLAVASLGGLTLSPLFTLILAPALLSLTRGREEPEGE